MNRQLPTILYVLAFALLLPLELLIWGSALDNALAGTYLSRRLQLNLLTDLPGWLIYVSGAAAFCGMVCGLVCRRNGCSRYDALLYGSFPLYMLMLFLHFRLFCAVALGIPLICLGTAGCWFAYRTPGRTPFLPPSDLTRCALWTERLSCLWLLLAVQFCGCLLLQEGYSLWAVSPKQGVFALLPFAGILLPKPGQLRDYVLGSVCALFCIGAVYGVGQLLIQDILQQLDFSVAMTWLFWELECALLLRPFLPKVRNSSLLILGLSACSTPQSQLQTSRMMLKGCRAYPDHAGQQQKQSQQQGSRRPEKEQQKQQKTQSAVPQRLKRQSQRTFRHEFPDQRSRVPDHQNQTGGTGICTEHGHDGRPR